MNAEHADTPRSRIFVHLSDIHFVKDFSDTSSYDIDSSMRHAIEQDISKMIPNVDHVDGLLISGDVAFAGKVEEYETARAWIEKLSGIVGCDPGYVWCVPGNHDVDQSVQTDLPNLFDTYAALRSATNPDYELTTRLRGRDSGPLMFLPLKNYHEQFGAKYDCPTGPKQPWWEDELLLNDHSILRIRGLNSALISSRKDKENVSKLILGTAQFQYRPESNVSYLTICHHPPDWLLDGQDAHEAMSAHSHLQLFGHKHRHHHEKINNTLRMYSGAVHPVRSERQWDPRYYLIRIRVEGDADTRELVVDVFPRVWVKTAFVRDAGDYEGLYLTERLKLPNWKAPPSTAKKSPELGDNGVSIGAPMTFDRKKLVNRFMMLPYHAQLSIMRTFDLFAEEERNTISDTELFISCFERAREKDVLEAVWLAIEAEARKSED